MKKRKPHIVQLNPKRKRARAVPFLAEIISVAIKLSPENYNTPDAKVSGLFSLLRKHGFLVPAITITFSEISGDCVFVSSITDHRKLSGGFKIVFAMQGDSPVCTEVLLRRHAFKRAEDGTWYRQVFGKQCPVSMASVSDAIEAITDAISDCGRRFRIQLPRKRRLKRVRPQIQNHASLSGTGVYLLAPMNSCRIPLPSDPRIAWKIAWRRSRRKQRLYCYHIHPVSNQALALAGAWNRTMIEQLAMREFPHASHYCITTQQLPIILPKPTRDEWDDDDFNFLDELVDNWFPWKPTFSTESFELQQQSDEVEIPSLVALRVRLCKLPKIDIRVTREFPGKSQLTLPFPSP